MYYIVKTITGVIPLSHLRLYVIFTPIVGVLAGELSLPVLKLYWRLKKTTNLKLKTIYTCKCFSLSL